MRKNAELRQISFFHFIFSFHSLATSREGAHICARVFVDQPAARSAAPLQSGLPLREDSRGAAWSASQTASEKKKACEKKCDESEKRGSDAVSVKHGLGSTIENQPSAARQRGCLFLPQETGNAQTYHEKKADQQCVSGQLVKQIARSVKP